MKSVAATLGGPGLLIIAFFDSSFLSFPEVNDLLIIANSYHNPERMLYYATMTVIGSVLGCAALYYVGRRGGSSLLHSKFKKEKIDRVRCWYDRYGVLAVIIPSILPPPTPFKIFVLAAGVFDIKVGKFIGAVLIGRSFRYYLEGYLAVRLGENAGDWMKANYPVIAIILAAGVLAVFTAYVLIRRKKEAVRR